MINKIIPLSLSLSVDGSGRGEIVEMWLFKKRRLCTQA
jgi:hypothetical protein